MTERDLTVSYGFRPLRSGGGGNVPMLRLMGSWLREAGFPVGSRVRVEVVESGRLVLSRLDENGEEVAELAGLVWVPAEQLAACARATSKAVAHA
jgi:Toxin SymE, type I toxin-antitoxin system